jgi:hypothetical protein
MSNKTILKLAALLALTGAIYSMIIGGFVISIFSLIIAILCYLGSKKVD